MMRSSSLVLRVHEGDALGQGLPHLLLGVSSEHDELLERVLGLDGQAAHLVELADASERDVEPRLDLVEVDLRPVVVPDLQHRHVLAKEKVDELHARRL